MPFVADAFESKERTMYLMGSGYPTGRGIFEVDMGQPMVT